MRHDASHRCDRRTLRQLAETTAELDLSAGTCTGFDSSALALAVTADLARSDARTRAQYEERCARSVARRLEISGLASWTADERSSLQRMAPALCLIPGLSTWSNRDREALTKIVRSKAANSETPAGKRMLAHRQLVAGLRAVCEGTGA